MKIGVLSDTHDRLPDKIAELFSEVDEIWHLGDVCSLQELSLLEHKPLCVVRGNCDSESWPLTLNLARDGVNFFLTHVPPHEIPKNINVVLHGHTHVPRDEIVKGVRFLNPGAVSKPREGSKASVAFLEVENGGLRNWKIVKL